MTINPIRLLAAASAAGVILMALTAAIAAAPTYHFATPVFGLAAAPDDSLFVADSGAGIVELRKGTASLFAALPGVTDIAPTGRGSMLAITSFGPGKLYRVSRGTSRVIADLTEFEARVNPDGGAIDSNPFDVEVLNGGTAIVADAAANAVLIVDERGNVDWIATLPTETLPSAPLKQIANCPNSPPDAAFICALPQSVPAQPVTASVAIGPDGAYYVGELKGIPATPGTSRIWRIEPGTRHAACGVSPACRVVAGGFTSIVDLTFGPDGTLYVVEFDEATWAAVQFGLNTAGGTVNACDSRTWSCSQVATALPLPIAAAVTSDGKIHVAVRALAPGLAEVITLR
jgi:hypothetical protein